MVQDRRDNGRQDPPILRIPDTDTCVQASGRYTMTVKGQSIDLTKMAMERAKTFACGYSPDPGCRIIAARDHQVAMDFNTAHTGLMTGQDPQTRARDQVPNTKRGVP